MNICVLYSLLSRNSLRHFSSVIEFSICKTSFHPSTATVHTHTIGYNNPYHSLCLPRCYSGTYSDGVYSMWTFFIFIHHPRTGLWLSVYITYMFVGMCCWLTTWWTSMEHKHELITSIILNGRVPVVIVFKRFAIERTTQSLRC